MRKILSLMMALVMALSLSPMAMAESFADGTYTGSGKGMMGNIEVSVTVEGGKITAVEVTSQSETAGISDPALETIPQAIVDAQSWEVDAVAGATFTSNGIMEAVKNAITGEGDTAEEPAEIPFEQTDIIVIGAGMAGMTTAARAAELGLNVLVLEQTGSVTGCPGDSRAVSGYALIVQETTTGLFGKFYIESDTHTFTDGKHEMALTLAFSNMMDEKEIENQSQG